MDQLELLDACGIATVVGGVSLALVTTLSHSVPEKGLFTYLALVALCLFRIGQRSMAIWRVKTTGNAASARDLTSWALGMAAIPLVACLFYVIGIRSPNTGFFGTLGTTRFWVASIGAGLAELAVSHYYVRLVGDDPELIS